MRSGSSDLAAYYDRLSRYQGVASWLGLGGGHHTLTVHRLLLADSPGLEPGHVVHERILAALGPMSLPRAIDAGCGAGGTIFYLKDRLSGEYDGLTLSAVQRDRAVREAGRRGVASSCRFHLRSYDDDLSDLAREDVDFVVAVESLAHADSPARTIGNLAKALRAGGRLVVVDDVPDDCLSDDDPDFVAFRDGWRCSAIARRSVLVEATERAGLSIEQDEDLTPLVPLRDPLTLERLVRVNRRWRIALRMTPAAVVLDALRGGLMLERLYRRHLVQYRLFVARRQ